MDGTTLVVAFITASVAYWHGQRKLSANTKNKIQKNINDQVNLLEEKFKKRETLVSQKENELKKLEETNNELEQNLAKQQKILNEEKLKIKTESENIKNKLELALIEEVKNFEKKMLIYLDSSYSFPSNKNLTLKKKLDEIEQYIRVKKQKLNEDETDLKLKRSETELKLAELKRIEKYINEREAAFKKDFITGRNWLAEFIVEAEKAFHLKDEEYLRNKRNPAVRGADSVRVYTGELREVKKAMKVLEYELKTYKELFPFLEEYSTEILTSDIKIKDKKIDETNELTDPEQLLINREDYDKLSPEERSQAALNRYLNKNHSSSEIGRMYERQIGYKYESLGYDVNFHGILQGFEDLGRDLIAKNDNEILIIQTKNWSQHSLIREKHIFNLFATAKYFELTQNNTRKKVRAIFYTTTQYSDTAQKVADNLNIDLRRENLNKEYPMIKCNIGSDGSRIFHLPFDQQYDKIKIELDKGELYVKTVREAIRKRFRRAQRHNFRNAA